MKLVLDNFIFSKTKNGGVSNYWYELCDYMLQNHRNEIKFFDYLPNLNYHRNKLDLLQENIVAFKSKGFITGALPLVYKSKEKFIYHSSYYRGLIGSPNMTEITTVHDFTHDYFFPLLQRKRHNLIKYSAIKRSSGIICISNNTYSDLKKFCPPVKGQKIAIIHHGVSDEYYPLTTASSQLTPAISVNKPYLLYVGARAGYKNFDFAVALLKELPGYNLIAVGTAFTKKEKLSIGSDVLHRVELLTNVDDKYLNVLYNNAHALLYPSDYEGFGMPIVEAMRAGCPVIALNSSSIAEVAGGHAVLFDKKSSADFKAGVLQLENFGYRQDIITKALLYSEKYSWQKSMQETYAFYTDVYKDV